MPPSRILFPLKIDHFLDGIREINVEVAALVTQIGNTRILIHDFPLTVFIFPDVKSNLRKQINSIIDFIELGLVCFLKHLTKLAWVYHQINSIVSHLTGHVYQTLRRLNWLILIFRENVGILTSQVEKGTAKRFLYCFVVSMDRRPLVKIELVVEDIAVN